MEVLKFKRGQIWWYRTGDNYNGSIQGKTRPVIIMSNDLANRNSNCLLGIPCTTAEKKNMPTHTTFYLDGTLSTALAENLMSINKDKLGDYIGNVDDELLEKLEYNVKIALGFVDVPRVADISKLPCENHTTVTDTKKLLDTMFNPTNITTYGTTAVSTIKKDSTDNDTVEEPRKYKKMTEDEKHRFLNDYENHTNEYMMKKYGIKDSKNLQQKVYLIRKEFGLGVRSK